MNDEFDFVIVGAGSAGCVLADRLSQDGRNTVLVLEYGGTDIGPFIQMPSALSYPMSMATYNWGYRTEPEKHLGGRVLEAPRGKVIGGSSSINGMVYVRGHAKDFDAWEALGARGWAFRDCLPYFKRLENAHGGEKQWRGTSGKMHVTRGSMKNPLYEAFIAAGVEAGYARTVDYNGYRQEGFGAMEMTIWKGRRWSAANAYLKPALKRTNLELRTGALVDRVKFKGKRALTVEYVLAGKTRSVKARREIILSASSFNSPAILQRSGIGDSSLLKSVGVEAVVDLPGVGRSLQDHLEVYVQHAVSQPVSLNSKLGLFSKGKIGLQWVLSKTGLGATNHFESCAFIRSAMGVEYPDIQFHFLPGAISYDGRAAFSGDGMQVHVGPNRSKSRGSVQIRSRDAGAAPKICFNYMSHEDDWRDYRRTIRLTREIFAQSALQKYALHEIKPGSDVHSDDEIDAFIAENVGSAFHPCGTCVMGDKDNPMAVVDNECRVLGVENLRVVDSSVFPQITNGNLNAPTLMVAEKAADLILGKPPLPPSMQQPFVHPDWQTSQR
ncbi:MAG TPA: choline dehydrogenase [Rhizobiales bacterium]|nr:choline dehydrogenase [Hyphomicrobiales bacterium]